MVKKMSVPEFLKNGKKNAIFIASILALLVAYWFDKIVIQWVESHRTDFIKDIFSLISDLGDGTEFFGVSVFVVFLGFVNRFNKNKVLSVGSKMLVDYGYLCLKALILTGLVTLLIKYGVGRSRPDLWVGLGLLEYNPFTLVGGRDFKSFPSGHTQTAFTVATLLTVIFPRSFHVYLYCVATLVGISRVVLLVHWPSDVVFGAIMGTWIPYLLILNEKRLTGLRL